MNPEQYLQQGDPKGALEALQAIVRTKPTDLAQRVLLFQLLVILGQWERALNQLNVLHDMDDSMLAMVIMYREVIQCEALREKVFQGDTAPVVFGEPEEWSALLVQAVALTAQGHHQQAAELRDRAMEMAPTSTGAVDGQAFEWIADADSRLGPVLEVIMEGRYLWVPFHRILSISVEPPEDLRDLVWLPVNFTWANGGESAGLIPTRYPFSYSEEDPLLALSRKTEWQSLDQQAFAGYGQRVLATDAEEYPLMDVRSITIDQQVSDLE